MFIGIGVIFTEYLFEFSLSNPEVFLLLYFVLAEVSRALSVSIALALAALLIFGGIEGQLTGARPLRSAVQTALIGFLAAATAFGIARLVDR